MRIFEPEQAVLVVIAANCMSICHHNIVIRLSRVVHATSTSTGEADLTNRRSFAACA